LRILLDACVLFPSVMREMVLGTAATGAFMPLWSARILEEWARATRRLPAGAEAIARAEISAMRVAWPESEMAVTEDAIQMLSLPDPDDRHVLAAAIAGGADTLMTLNRGDFPTRILGRHGLILREPDGFLTELLHEGVDVASVAAVVLRRGESLSGRPQALRSLLKRAGLPRLGKALVTSEPRPI
jgi:predicted nucleic acid-binding protein